MAEQYRLKTDFSRLERDERDQLRSRQYKAGDMIEPTPEELRAFPDKFESLTAAPAAAPPPEPPPDEPTPRSRR
jgi:hypothetical protein